MAPTDSASSAVRRTVDALLSLRERDEPAGGPPAAGAAASIAASAEAIEALLGQLTASGLPAREGRAIAQALANLADLWLQEQQRRRGGEAPAGEPVTARVLGEAGGERSFVPSAQAERASVGAATLGAWSTALALGCRGPLRAADAMRLCLELAPTEARQVLADGLMGPGRRPDGRRQALTWLPAALGLVAAAMTVGLAMLLHADAGDLLAAGFPLGRPV